jgi:hypothetical protein
MPLTGIEERKPFILRPIVIYKNSVYDPMSSCSSLEVKERKPFNSTMHSETHGNVQQIS